MSTLFPYKTDADVAKDLAQLDERVEAARFAAREERAKLDHLRDKAAERHENYVEVVAKHAEAATQKEPNGVKEERAEHLKKLVRARDKYRAEAEDTARLEGIERALRRVEEEREGFLHEEAETIAAELVAEAVDLQARFHKALNGLLDLANEWHGLDGRWATVGRYLSGVETRLLGESTIRQLERAVRVAAEVPVPAPGEFRPAPEPDTVDPADLEDLAA
ncbi:MAG: hypothetical protein M3377_07865 [Actinomycetota bacterium]|nr:hypothetical protein [Actinomycetota bacterium]